jgi:hypothetical protein
MSLPSTIKWRHSIFESSSAYPTFFMNHRMNNHTSTNYNDSNDQPLYTLPQWSFRQISIGYINHPTKTTARYFWIWPIIATIVWMMIQTIVIIVVRFQRLLPNCTNISWCHVGDNLAASMVMTIAIPMTSNNNENNQNKKLFNHNRM